MDVSLEILVRRFEIIGKFDFSKVKEPDEKLLKKFDKYFKLNHDKTANYGKLKKISLDLLKNKKSYIEKVRAIYDYVYDNMEYSKEIPGYGTGDVERACEVKAGNCIDFHSLFVALANVSGIISTEVANIDIPIEAVKPDEPGFPNYCNASYHCNAEVFLPNLNIWLPLDISHAKKKNKKYFYFGSLDNLRLKIGRRGNVLLPKSDIRIPRILTKPYVLIDGKEFENVDVYIIARSYEDIKRYYHEIVHPGDRYISFKAEDMNGNWINLDDYIGKKYILINFFTTWCGRYQWESEGLNKVYSQYKDKFIFLRVMGEGKDKVKEFINKFGAPFPVLLDPKGEISLKYGIKYVPANIVIGLDGKVKEVTGLLPEKDLRQKIQKILKYEKN